MVFRFKPVDPQSVPVSGEDSLPEYMNVLGMLFSMCGLMMRLKWCSFAALLASCISFANTRVTDDTKQIVSSFMYVSYYFSYVNSFRFRLSISAVVMSYLQNPSPIVPPWS